MKRWRGLVSWALTGALIGLGLAAAISASLPLLLAVPLLLLGTGLLVYSLGKARLIDAWAAFVFISLIPGVALTQEYLVNRCTREQIIERVSEEFPSATNVTITCTTRPLYYVLIGALLILGSLVAAALGLVASLVSRQRA